MRLEELKERMLERVEDESEYLKEELEILQQETGVLPHACEYGSLPLRGRRKDHVDVECI